MPTVTLKLTDTETAVLDELVYFSRFKSRSDCLRKGLYTLAHQRKLKRETTVALSDERKIHTPRRHGHAQDKHAAHADHGRPKKKTAAPRPKQNA